MIKPTASNQPFFGRWPNSVTGAVTVVVILLAFLFLLAACSDPAKEADPSDSETIQLLLGDGQRISFQESFSLAPYLEVLPAMAAANLATAEANTNWQKLDPTADHPGAYWLRFKLANPSPKSLELVLYCGYAQDLQVYGLGSPVRVGTMVPASKKSHLLEPAYFLRDEGFSNQLAIKLATGETKTIYCYGTQRIEKSQAIDLRLLTPGFLERTAGIGNSDFWNGLFQGMIWILILYHLLLFITLREGSYFYYCLYMLCISALTLGDFGYWQKSLLREFPILSWHLFLLMQFVTGVMTLVFMRSFVNLKALLPRWDRLTKQVILVFTAIIALLGLYYFPTGDGRVLQLAKILVLPFSLFGLVLCVVLWRSEDVVARYFAAAGAVMAVSVGINSIAELLQSGDHLGTDFSRFYIIQATVILHLLTFALGMGYRRRERDLDWQKTKELDALKTRFYANITHEFRTPLTVILGMNQQIEDNQQATKLIRRNAQQLLRLINQLLGLSRLESGQDDLHLVQGDVVPYLRYLTESFHSLAGDKEIQLTFYPETEAILMDYDEVKLQHIINNLLSNAIKFTEIGGKIVVHLSQQEKRGKAFLQLKIQDNGIGIAPDKLPLIFDRFYQTNSEEVHSGEGTGIGLAYTRELVRLLSGDISAESRLGEGTTFTLTLPISRQPNTTAATSPEVDTVLTHPMPAPAAAPESSNQDAEFASKQAKEELPLLLLVEDNYDVVTYIETLLSPNHRIVVATDGQMGIDLAQELIPDVIISDIMMPKVNGYVLCATLKKDERTSHVPIILLTAKVTQADKLAGLDSGADAFLTKPFQKEELFIRLRQLVILRRKLQQRYAHFGKTTPPAPVKAAELSPDDLFLEKLEQAVLEQLGETDFGVPELAQSVYLSQMQVYRKLKALLNRTPSQFIRSIRLRQGQELLRNPDLNISEIAYDVGFADPNYFSRVFNEEFGISPSDWRQRNL